jgi:hypothetical protein
MELDFFERRFSECSRVYRAGAKSSIGVWARQVSADDHKRRLNSFYDRFVTIFRISRIGIPTLPMRPQAHQQMALIYN